MFFYRIIFHRFCDYTRPIDFFFSSLFGLGKVGGPDFKMDNVKILTPKKKTNFMCFIICGDIKLYLNILIFFKN